MEGDCEEEQASLGFQGLLFVSEDRLNFYFVPKYNIQIDQDILKTNLSDSYSALL